MTRPLISPRLTIGAGLVTLLVLGGAGASHALWSSTAAVSATASTATVGVTHVLSGSTLARTYSSSDLVGVGVVTVTNTSSRSAAYSTSVTSTGSTSLRSAVSIEIGTAATCTAAATLGSAVTGTLASAVTRTGTLAAGASVALCVRTSMTAAAVSSNASVSLTAAVASTVTVGTWTATAAPALSFAQSTPAAAAPATFTNSGARYTISNQSVCVSRQWDSAAPLLRGNGCSTAQLAEWRLVAGPTGTYSVTSAYNESSQPNLRWSASTASAAVGVAAASDAAAQQWKVESRPDGLHRFVNQALSRCLVVSTELSNGNPVLKTAACDNGAIAQGFQVTMVGNASPAPVTLTCSSNGSNYVSYTWPVLSNYQAVVTYKVYIEGVFVMDYSNGWSPNAQLYNNQAPFVTIANYGSGTKTVEVRQSVSGGEWTTTGTAPLVIQASTNNLLCG